MTGKIMAGLADSVLRSGEKEGHEEQKQVRQYSLHQHPLLLHGEMLPVDVSGGRRKPDLPISALHTCAAHSQIRLEHTRHI